MQIFKTKRLLSKELEKIGNHNQVGFIPTMGCLHAGHISLIKEQVNNGIK